MRFNVLNHHCAWLPSPIIPYRKPEPEPIHLEMDMEPISTTRSFYGATVYLSHGGLPTSVLTAHESLRVNMSDLPLNVSQADIQRLTGPFGNVVGAIMIPPTMEHPSFGALVEFSRSADAEDAASRLDGTWFRNVSISVRSDCRGVVHKLNGDFGSRYVRLTWNAPSRVGWAYYQTITKAKAAQAGLNKIKFDGHIIEATFLRPRKSQNSDFAVKITGLPLDVNQRRLQDFCVQSTLASIGEATYTEDPVQALRNLLTGHGRLDALHMLPAELDRMKCVAIAQFTDSMAALSAAQTMNGRQPAILGHNRVSAQQVYVATFSVRKSNYVMIKNELDSISQELGTACKMQRHEHPEHVRLYLHSTSLNIFTDIRMRLEALINGEAVRSQDGEFIWDPYLGTNQGKQVMDALNKGGKFLVQVDEIRQRVYVIGPSSERGRAQTIVENRIGKLRKSCHRIVLQRTIIRALLLHDLEVIHKDFPHSLPTLDMSTLTLRIYGM
ncbi:hypothetical protein ONZ45_g11644 [Pleurotus djamor]|nr:hypothetical protein ONZ45_g11644 [Pleurotus djamor]